MARKFNGKRSFRMLVNIDPELADIIEERAIRRFRTIGSEIEYLLTFATLNDPEANVHDQFRMNEQDPTQERNYAQRRAS